jgi:hypothetical protein
VWRKVYKNVLFVGQFNTHAEYSQRVYADVDQTNAEMLFSIDWLSPGKVKVSCHVNLYNGNTVKATSDNSVEVEIEKNTTGKMETFSADDGNGSHSTLSLDVSNKTHGL